MILNFTFTIMKLTIATVIILISIVSTVNSTENNENVIFSLYTKNSKAKELTNKNIHAVETSKYTVFIVPGWRSNLNESWVFNMVQTYLQKDDLNVITVSWSNYSLKNYLNSYLKVATVGQIIANFVIQLSGNSEKFLDKVHFVGHSMGAHISGYAGYAIYREAFYKVAKITGLDPAKPGYASRSLKYRLSIDDARLVVIIHTNGGVLGLNGVEGTVDFYPNGGGPIQPGCNIMDEICSHQRAYEYFTESILSDSFIARECGSWEKFKTGNCSNNSKLIMGEDVPQTATGRYFLRTNGQPPYAKN